MKDLLSTESLVATFVHSLWQGVLILGSLYLILYVFRVKSAWWRYNLGVLSLFLLCCCVVGTYISGLDFTQTTLVVEAPVFAVERPMPGPVLFDEEPWALLGWLRSNSYYLTWLWLLGVAVLTIRLSGGLLYIARINRQAYLPVNQDLLIDVERLCRKLNIKRKVSLKLSDHIGTPLTSRVFKPVILFPASLITSLSPDQIETIVLHELAHIRRHDYLINLLQHVIETLLFFNPFVWLLSGFIRKEREHCCDDIVVELCPSRVTYVKALAQVEEIRWGQVRTALALAGNNKGLLVRIKRIMERTAPVTELKFGLVFMAVTLLTGFTVYEFQCCDDRDRITQAEEAPVPSVEPLMGIFPSVPPDILSVDVPVASQDVPLVEVLAQDTVIREPYYQYSILKKIKERFPDFYEENQAEFEQMMEEIYEKPEDKEAMILLEEYGKAYGEGLHTLRRRREEMARLELEMAQKHSEEARRKLVESRKKLLQLHHVEMATLQEQLNRMSLEAKKERTHVSREDVLRTQKEILELERDLARQSVELKRQEEQALTNYEEFTKLSKVREPLYNELTVELLRDGYFKKNEKIESLRLRNEGDIVINGKKIKNKHKEKYLKIKGKYIEDGIEVVTLPEDIGQKVEQVLKQKSIKERQQLEAEKLERQTELQKLELEIERQKVLLKVQTVKQEKFREEVISQLVKDDYLDPDEKLRSFRIEKNKVTVNGTSVKASDVDNYLKILKKYFGEESDSVTLEY